MLKRIVGRLVKKHGMKKLLIMIGDWAVKQSKKTSDDEAWELVVKPYIEENM